MLNPSGKRELQGDNAVCGICGVLKRRKNITCSVHVSRPSFRELTLDSRVRDLSQELPKLMLFVLSGHALYNLNFYRDDDKQIS